MALCKLREGSRHGKPLKWNKVEGTTGDTIPYRNIEETKTAENCPPHPPRHDRPGTYALFVSLKTAFHWSAATGTMRESTRFGATCSESILTKCHVTTTAFETFFSLTPIPPRSRN
jgi:hypothetical protein